jgi:putative SOS response-associated peptidase YedK
LIEHLLHWMPLILPREAHQAWVFGTTEEAAKLIVPAPGIELAAHRVSERVNRPQNQGAELIAGVDV